MGSFARITHESDEEDVPSAFWDRRRVRPSVKLDFYNVIPTQSIRVMERKIQFCEFSSIPISDRAKYRRHSSRFGISPRR